VQPPGEIEDADSWSFYHEMLRHAQLSHAVGIAAEWRVADHIAAGVSDLDALSSVVGCDREGLARLLRVLESARIVARCKRGRYELTARGALLHSDADGGVRNTMTWWSHYRWPVWTHLATSLRTGRGSRARALGFEGFDQLDADGEAAAAFNGAMAELARQLGKRLSSAYDFAGVKTIVDVGGGDGTVLSALLTAQPGVRGVLVDLPHAVAAARSKLSAQGVADRCDALPGDFFDSVPARGDLYILQRVLHDWDDERCVAICSKCREAMPEHARLLVIERVLPSRIDHCDDHLDVTISDLNVLVMLGARERSEHEIRAILAKASLQCSTTIELLLGFRAIVAATSPKAPGGDMRMQQKARSIGSDCKGAAF
jgi:orsellinic acid C2-O-methyltransferase